MLLSSLLSLDTSIFPFALVALLSLVTSFFTGLLVRYSEQRGPRSKLRVKSISTLSGSALSSAASEFSSSMTSSESIENLLLVDDSQSLVLETRERELEQGLVVVVVVTVL